MFGRQLMDVTQPETWNVLTATYVDVSNSVKDLSRHPTPKYRPRGSNDNTLIFLQRAATTMTT